MGKRWVLRSMIPGFDMPAYYSGRTWNSTQDSPRPEKVISIKAAKIYTNMEDAEEDLIRCKLMHDKTILEVYEVKE